MFAQVGDIVQINLYEWVADNKEKYTRVKFALIVDTCGRNDKWCVGKYFDDNTTCEFTRDTTQWFDSKNRPTIVKIS